MLGLCWEITDQKLAELELQKAKLKSEESERNLLVKNEEYEVINEELVQTNEELLKALEKAEESERLKSAFLANMSHEIRTPMNGILGFADLLKEPDLTGEQQQKYLAIIEKSGHRLLNTINELIEISKIDAKQVKVAYSDTNLIEVTDFLYNFFKPEMEKKNLEFILHTPHKSGNLTIKTDKEKLYAILINLLKNAVKYTRTGKVDFGYSMEKGLARFFVKDTGIGIPKDRQKAIFERFVQADIEDKNAMEGSGLGLAISKAYCEMLGGQLMVDSDIGKGSTFWLTIPNNHTIPTIEAVFSENEPQKTEHPLKNLSVLIVEDEEISDMYLTEMLKNHCMEIFHASSGTQAIDLFRNNRDIQLILMDIKMPGMDGLETTRIIRKTDPKVVIIAQTAFALPGDREKSIEAGCNDYLTKPIKRSSLLDLIGKYFSA
jgi:signal transduction histidine kinase